MENLKECVSYILFTGILSLIVLIGGFAYLYLFPDRDSSAIVGMMMMILGYYFGSSESSKKKTDILGEVIENQKK